MSLGVVLTADQSTSNAVDVVVAQARQAAGAGVRHVWFAQRFDYDSPALAALVGREVPEVSVGTSAVPIFGRHPIALAASAATAQAATHGRYTLGLGLGSRAFVEEVYGVPFERPIARLRDFLSALRPLLANGSVDFDGETITAKTPLPSALPGATPPVRVLVAALGPQALRVAGELADGTLPYLVGPRALAEHIVAPITKAAEAAGRPAPRVVAGVLATVTDDVDAARERAVRATAFYDGIPSYQRTVALSGGRRAADLVTVGDEETVAAEIRRYFDAGATEVFVTQTDLGGPAGRLRTWKLLGELAEREHEGA
jgi:F420-dependent oxidoreductase-like protein